MNKNQKETINFENDQEKIGEENGPKENMMQAIKSGNQHEELNKIIILFTLNLMAFIVVCYLGQHEYLRGLRDLTPIVEPVPNHRVKGYEWDQELEFMRPLYEPIGDDTDLKDELNTDSKPAEAANKTPKTKPWAGDEIIEKWKYDFEQGYYRPVFKNEAILRAEVPASDVAEKKESSKYNDSIDSWEWDSFDGYYKPVFAEEGALKMSAPVVKSTNQQNDSIDSWEWDSFDGYYKPVFAEEGALKSEAPVVKSANQYNNKIVSWDYDAFEEYYKPVFAEENVLKEKIVSPNPIILEADNNTANANLPEANKIEYQPYADSTAVKVKQQDKAAKEGDIEQSLQAGMAREYKYDATLKEFVEVVEQPALEAINEEEDDYIFDTETKQFISMKEYNSKQPAELRAATPAPKQDEQPESQKQDPATDSMIHLEAEDIKDQEIQETMDRLFNDIEAHKDDQELDEATRQKIIDYYRKIWDIDAKEFEEADQRQEVHALSVEAADQQSKPEYDYYFDDQKKAFIKYEKQPENDPKVNYLKEASGPSFFGFEDNELSEEHIEDQVNYSDEEKPKWFSSGVSTADKKA